jgi:hypothetical protein
MAFLKKRKDDSQTVSEADQGGMMQVQAERSIGIQ